jgi:hypothetical protein
VPKKAQNALVDAAWTLDKTRSISGLAAPGEDANDAEAERLKAALAREHELLT